MELCSQNWAKLTLIKAKFKDAIFLVQAVLSSKRLIGRLDLLKSNKLLWWLSSDQFEFKLLWPCHAGHGHMYLIMHLQRPGPIKITDTEQKKVLQFFGIAHVNCVAWWSWLIVAKSGLWGLTFSNCTPNPTNDSGYPFFLFLLWSSLLYRSIFHTMMLIIAVKPRDSEVYRIVKS